MPAASRTLNSTLPAPLAKVAPVQLMAVPPALVVMSAQVAPPSTEPNKMSPVLKAADSVALMVWLGVLVTRSLPLVPLSTLKAVPLTLVVGAWVSSV